MPSSKTSLKQFIGHRSQVNFLKKISQNKTLAQAYLFSGPERVGKFTLAQFWAYSLIKNEPLFFRNRITFLSDLILLKPEQQKKKTKTKEKDIGVKAIKEAQRELNLYPVEGKKRILIINQAHRLTTSAQNALLKTIEEPNDTSLIILVTHQEKSILPTIKSRCQIINFSLVSSQEMIKAGWNKELVYFSMGRPGVIQTLVKNLSEKEKYQNILKDLKFVLNHDYSINQRLELADEYSIDMEKGKEWLNFWIWILWLQAHKTKDLPQKRVIYKKIEKIEAVLEIINQTNADPKLQLENLFLEL